MKASVIIPAYNEGRRIGSVLESMPNGYEVIVVDDGSVDDTAEKVRKFGAKVVRLRKNCGKTKACLEGIRRSSHEFCIFMDGDGQHYPEDIPKIVGGLKHADIVIGSRDMKKVPLQRRLSNWYARKSVKFITGKNFSDALCGFRGVRKSVFRRLEFEKNGYFFESEMAIKAAEKNLRIRFVPVGVSYEHGANMGISKSLAVASWLLRKCIGKFSQL